MPTRRTLALLGTGAEEAARRFEAGLKVLRPEFDPPRACAHIEGEVCAVTVCQTVGAYFITDLIVRKYSVIAWRA
jgi:hypothetical protein